jgi:hypothetical protein
VHIEAVHTLALHWGSVVPRHLVPGQQPLSESPADATVLVNSHH